MTCSPNPSGRKTRATVSQKSPSSEQLDSEDDMNDLDADASTDEDMAQFVELNQAADDALSQSSTYPKVGSGSNVSKHSQDLPSLQRPTYNILPSSHDVFGKLQD